MASINFLLLLYKLVVYNSITFREIHGSNCHPHSFDKEESLLQNISHHVADYDRKLVRPLVSRG